MWPKAEVEFAAGLSKRRRPGWHAGVQDGGWRIFRDPPIDQVSRHHAAQEGTMDKKIILASLLAAAPLLTQAAEPVTVDSAGYDVAASAIVIHGSNFTGAAQRAPEVRV